MGVITLDVMILVGIFIFILYKPIEKLSKYIINIYETYFEDKEEEAELTYTDRYALSQGSNLRGEKEQ